MEFRFRDGLKSSYDQETRGFVLRRYLLERRLRSQERKRAAIAATREGVGADDDRSDNDVGLQQGSSKLEDNMEDWPVVTPAIRTTLGQGRVDPFQCFAKPVGYFEQHVSGDYLVFLHLSRQTFNPCRDLLFQYIIQDPDTILATVAYVANNLELRGALPSALYSSKYTALACHRLKIRVEPEDGANLSIFQALTVCGLICGVMEKARASSKQADYDELSKHITGLRSVLAAIGGWQAASDHSQSIRWILAWVDICTYGNLSVGFTVPSFRAYETPPRFNRIRDVTGSVSYLYAKELIGMYGEFYDCALALRIRAKTSPHHGEIWSPLDLFQHGTVAYRILTSNIVGLVPSIAPSIAPLLMVNIISRNLRDCTNESHRALFSIYERRLQAVCISQSEFVENLVWGLMTDTETRRVADPDGLELLGRLLYIVGQLKPSTQQILAGILLDFFQYKRSQTEIIRTWWTVEQFADIICSDIVPN